MPRIWKGILKLYLSRKFIFADQSKIEQKYCNAQRNETFVW